MSENTKPKCEYCGKEIEGIDPLEVHCHVECMLNQILKVKNGGRNIRQAS